MNVMRGKDFNQLMPPQTKADMLSVLSFMENLGDELENASE
jgi:multiple sugar transport system substrate-binding protein